MSKPAKSGIKLAITIGDPGGIGPETALKAAYTKRWPHAVQLVLIGDRRILRRDASMLGFPLPPPWRPASSNIIDSFVVNWDPSREQKNISSISSWKPGSIGKTQGEASAQWIRSAVSGCRAGWFDGMVTGPICKKSVNLARIKFPGQTEYLAYLTDTSCYAMMLIGGPLRVVLATRHMAVSEVPSALNKKKIIEAVRLTSQALAWLQEKTRLIGVCALNPHGGEQGLLGIEEQKIIIPALQNLRKKGFDIEGPVPSDVIFHHAINNRYGAIVAMYHDQGLAPLKMIAFESGVNLTLGLPIIRTSPDHGVGFDIAGKGKANPGSMIEAIRLALLLSKRQNPWHIN